LGFPGPILRSNIYSGRAVVFNTLGAELG
jgi:hypothetical protein